MGYSMPDVYYQPEAFDLTPIAEIDFVDCYEFDIVCAWKHADGTIYWANDSGCSCPSPFENYNSLADLAAGSFSELETFVQAVHDEHASWGGRQDSQVADFLMKVRPHF